MNVENEHPVKCRHFAECGGCSLLNLSCKEQLARKAKMLNKIFPEFTNNIIPSPEPFYYRHKVQLPFGTAAGKTVLGCFARDSHRVIDQKECYIQDRDLTAVAFAIREWAWKYNLTPYNEKNNTGFLRHILLRKGKDTGEILIGLVTNGKRPAGSRFLSRKLLELISGSLSPSAEIVGIVQNVNMRRTNVVLGEEEHTWWGRPFLKEKLGQLKFKLGISTFFQVNPFQTPNLYNEVLKWIPEKSDVLDIYSGTGSISLWVSSRASTVLGIEENRASVNAAKAAASLNGIRNVKFLAGDASVLFSDISGADYTVAIVDPPRKGLEQQMLEEIKKSGLKRLIYVSCNPESLASDIEHIKPQFRLISIQGFDMFPHTSHIECVAVLDRDQM